jgi:two-component sensor histidine kinase
MILNFAGRLQGIDTSKQPVVFDEVLGELGRFIEADRAYYFYISGNENFVKNSNEWCASGVSEQKKKLQKVSIEEEIPWLYEKMQHETVVSIPDVSALPKQAEQEKRHFEEQDIQSLIIYPVRRNGKLRAFLGFDSVRCKRDWPESLNVNLLLLAQYYFNVLLGREREYDMEMVSALHKASLAVLENRSFEETARTIFDIAKEVTGATAGYIALLSDDGSENEVLFLDDGGMGCSVNPDLPMPIRGLRSLAYKSGAAVVDNSFMESEWEQFLPSGHVRLENVLFAPLPIENKIVGLMGLANKKGNFSEIDKSMATGFGSIAAAALKNARAKDRIEELLSEKEILLRETHHRVKNNLNMISSMLGIQSRSAASQETADILEQTQTRVQAMLTVYKELFNSKDFQKISLKHYIHELIKNISLSIDMGPIRLEENLQDIVVVSKTAGSLGMLLTEIITNAVKYAFPRGGDGIVSIALRKDDENGRIYLTVADNGCGMAECSENKDGFGMLMIRSLVDGLEGSIDITSSGSGTTYTIVLPSSLIVGDLHL